jgi:signal transduction histidine kinase
VARTRARRQTARSPAAERDAGGAVRPPRPPASAELRQLAFYLEAVRDHERSAIAREIHDELGHALTALKMDIVWLASKLAGERPELDGRLRAMAELADGTIATMRRIATELRPRVLDELGLVEAIEWRAADFSERTGIATELALAAPEPPPSPQVAAALFRILQEALTNVARHAAARRVRIELRRDGQALLLRVADDGRGASPAALRSPESLGLLGMRERAAMLGGTATVQSGRRGTTVSARLPLEAPEEPAA